MKSTLLILFLVCFAVTGVSAADYRWENEIIKIVIPDAKNFEKGYKGGKGVISFKGYSGGKNIYCNMYIQRKWARGGYENTAIGGRSAPGCENAVLRIGDVVFIDKISRFEVKTIAAKYVTLMIKKGRLKANLGNCPLEMRGVGYFEIKFSSGGEFQVMTPDAYKYKVPSYYLRGKRFDRSRLEITKYGAKLEVRRKPYPPLRSVGWKKDGGKYRLDWTSPAEKLEEVRKICTVGPPRRIATTPKRTTRPRKQVHNYVAPHRRHKSWKVRARGGGRTMGFITVYTGGLQASVQKDVDLINRHDGRVRNIRARVYGRGPVQTRPAYLVNGRVYAYHRRGSGKLIPVRGRGFYMLTGDQYFALGIFNDKLRDPHTTTRASRKGRLRRAYRYLQRKGISKPDIRRAFQIWKVGGPRR